MKRVFRFVLTVTFIVSFVPNSGYAWQGRMGGMGDPFGLITDESDFLIHPSKVATGEGIRFYGDYRFTHTDVTRWSYRLNQLNIAGNLNNYFNFDSRGDENGNNVLVGAALPLGAGRMGLFFAYDGMRSGFDGVENLLPISNYARYNLNRDFDNFALRLLYGLPVGGSWKLGGELQFAYRQEMSKSLVQTIGPSSYLNYILNMATPDLNVLPLLKPYDSSYWEAIMKGSLEGKAGPLDFAFTLRGGVIMSGDNKFVIERNLFNFINARAAQNGGIGGWRIGGDLWLRYALANDLVTPVLVRIDYSSKGRDAAGRGEYSWLPWTNISSKFEETELRLTTGGGVEKQFGAGSKVAGGIYYNYLQGENGIRFHADPYTFEHFDSNEFPDSTEHQIALRLAGEIGLSRAVTLRMGLAPFFGWVRENNDFTYTRATIPLEVDRITQNGTHWGVGASIGGTIMLKSVTLEPFVSGGWQKLSLDGNGDSRSIGGIVTNLWQMDKKREAWNIGGGLSIRFN